jgi:hypothetical protein
MRMLQIRGQTVLEPPLRYDANGLGTTLL